MTGDNALQITETLSSFIDGQNSQYQNAVDKLPLFDPQRVANFDLKTKQSFVRIFYHIRGHFHHFLWFMLNFAPNQKEKEIILDNIREEAGGNKLSHEALYHIFAKQFDVDVMDEYVNKTHCLPFVNQFNHQHIAWLSQHDWPHQLSAFAAYEKLDNIDYHKLYQLAMALGAEGQSLIFFKIHTQVQHFESTLDSLNEVWLQNSNIVKDAFSFIYQNQLTVWQNLSDYLI